MPGLVVDDLAVSYAGVTVVHGISLAVDPGKTLAIVGPSGAGKTTLLRAIAGLQPADRGDVRVDGASVSSATPQRRHIGMVFQHDVLFEGMSVASNLRFALRERGGDDAVADAAAAFRIAGLLDRRPRSLSGGERQRAALARALLSQPRALLMDEPLAHVDPALRRTLRAELLDVRERYGGPIVYVTHDHAEAMAAGDELAVLIGGRILDTGCPQRVFDAPACLEVARFLGDPPMNLLANDGTVTGIRPEHVRVQAGGDVSGRVVAREPAGADALLTVETARGRLCARVDAGARFAIGDAVDLVLPADRVRRFDLASGAAIA